MVKQLILFIQDESGGSVVGEVINHLTFWVASFLGVVFILSLLPTYPELMQLNNCALEIRNAIADSGGIFDETRQKIETIQQYTITVDSIDYTGTDFMFGTHQVQLDGDIVVIVRKTLVVAEGFGWEFQIPAKAVKYGNSNVYWKD